MRKMIFSPLKILFFFYPLPLEKNVDHRLVVEVL